MSRRLHAALATIALVAWALFILACTGASWSPDGTKILFSFRDPDSRQFGVAYYDVTTGTTTPLFLRAYEESDPVAFAQWQRDGSRALIFTVPLSDASSNVTVLALPVGSGGTARQFSLPGVSQTPGLLPYPEINGNLFLDGPYLARLNLETGRVKRAQLPKDKVLYLFTDGSRLFSIGGSDEVAEIAEVDQETLERRRLFQFTAADVSKHGVEVQDVIPIPAMDPRSGLIAMVATAGEKNVIVLCSLQGIERILTPDIALPQYALANLEWAPNGRMLYATVVSTADDKNVIHVAEVPLDGSSARLTEVLRLAGSSNLSGWHGMVPLPLSPDGSTLAISAADFDPNLVGAKDRALYLVKIGESERRVTVVPAPHPAYSPDALPEDPHPQAPPSPGQPR